MAKLAISSISKKYYFEPHISRSSKKNERKVPSKRIHILWWKKFEEQGKYMDILLKGIEEGHRNHTGQNLVR